MAQKIGELFVEIGANLSNLKTGLQNARNEVSQTSTNLTTAFKNIENRAKVFGKEVNIAGEKQLVLKNKMNELLKQGVNPNSVAMQNLATHYRRFGAEAKKTEDSLRGFGNVAKIVAATIGATLVSGLKTAIQTASDLQEETDKFNVVFKGVENSASLVARNLQENFGLSELAAKKLLGSTGDLLTGFGFTSASALRLSKDVQELAVDLASFSNFSGGAAGASQILTKALLGERDSLVSLGIKITDTELKQRALAEGVKLVNGQIPRQAQAMLTLKIAAEQSKNAVGSFAATQESFANQTRILQSRINDLFATIGQLLLPVAKVLIKEFVTGAENAILFAKGIAELGRLAGNVAKRFDSLSVAVDVAATAIRASLDITTLGALRLTEFAAKAIRDLGKKAELEKAALEASAAATEDFASSAGDLGSALGVTIPTVTRFGRGSRSAGDDIKKLTLNVREFAIETAERMGKAAEEMKEKLKEGFTSTLSFASSSLGQLASILQQQTQNQLSILQQGQAERLALLEEERNAELERLGLEDETTAQREEKKLADLEDRLARETKGREREKIKQQIQDQKDAIKKEQILENFRKKEVQINKDAEKEQRKLQREAAKTQKQLAIAQTLLDIPTASFSAYKSLVGIPIVGPTLAAAAAAAATALGFKKLQIIKETPALQEGGVVTASPGGRLIQVAEGGENEAVIPLTRRIFANLADAILNEIAVRQESETAAEATVETVTEATPVIGGDVILDGEKIGEWITKGTADARIRISERAIVET